MSLDKKLSRTKSFFKAAGLASFLLFNSEPIAQNYPNLINHENNISISNKTKKEFSKLLKLYNKIDFCELDSYLSKISEDSLHLCYNLPPQSIGNGNGVFFDKGDSSYASLEVHFKGIIKLFKKNYKVQFSKGRSYKEDVNGKVSEFVLNGELEEYNLFSVFSKKVFSEWDNVILFMSGKPLFHIPFYREEIDGKTSILAAENLSYLNLSIKDILVICRKEVPIVASINYDIPLLPDKRINLFLDYKNKNQ